MKKTLLLAAGLMLSTGAMAQTLTTVWKAATPSTPLVRTTAGFGDKVYVAYAPNNDGSAGYIEEWVNGEVVATYKVNDKMVEMGRLKQVEKEDGTMGWQGDMMWSNIMTDDADNIMVGLGTGGSVDSSKKFVYIPANDRNNMQVLEIADFPSDAFKADRFDVPCRIVGDIATTGAYMYIAASNNSVIPVMYIYINSEGKIDYDLAKSKALTVDANFNSSSNVATLSTFAELNSATTVNEFAAKTYTFSRSQYPKAWSETGGKFTDYKVIEKGGNCAGMDVFSIAGVDYMAIKKKYTGSYAGASFEVRNIATGESVATWNAEESTTSYVGSMMARVNADGYSANIYVCGQKGNFGIVRFEVPADPTAIEEVGADNAAVEYYNLQGVKVANPENGIFIKKQGTKTTKVVL